MSHLLLVIIATFIIITLAGFIFFRTRAISFLIGLFVIYYFTLLGGVIITVDKLTNDYFKKVGMNYYYLYDKMYEVFLNDNYFVALYIYSMFIIVIELTLLLLAVPVSSNNRSKYIKIEISHNKLIGMSLVFCAVSVAITHAYIIEALRSGISAYVLIRYADELIPFYTIHQIFIRMAVFTLPIGIATYICGHNGKYMTAARNKYVCFGYICLSIFILLYLALLGNRSELLVGVVTGCIFYFTNSSKVSFPKLAVFGLVIMSLLGVIGGMRATDPNEYFASIDLPMIFGGILNAITSNEIIAAHMSLYGALSFDIPLVYGYSLISLIASIIPRTFWSGRPLDIYYHYFNHINAIPGQGYVIHHATGWYLNFGVVGVVVGAVLIGYIWINCYNKTFKVMQSEYLFLNLFKILANSLFIGSLIPLLRGGLEGYKAVIVEHFVFPLLVIWLASKTNTRHLNHNYETAQ